MHAKERRRQQLIGYCVLMARQVNWPWRCRPSLREIRLDVAKNFRHRAASWDGFTLYRLAKDPTF